MLHLNISFSKHLLISFQPVLQNRWAILYFLLSISESSLTEQSHGQVKFTTTPRTEHFILLVVPFRLFYAVFIYVQSASSIMYMYSFQSFLFNLFNIQGVIQIIN